VMPARPGPCSSRPNTSATPQTSTGLP
jgi:hypothetical protein